MDLPTFTIRLTVTEAAAQDGPWQPGENHDAGTVDVAVDPANEGPSWDSASEAWDHYYDLVLDAVRTLIDPAELDLDVLRDRFDDPEGTIDEWLDFGDYRDDAEGELVAALGRCALPMITWARVDTGATFEHLMEAGDLGHRGEMLHEYGFGEIDSMLRKLFPREEMLAVIADARRDEERAEAEREAQRAADRAARRRAAEADARARAERAAEFEATLPACPRCGSTGGVQTIVRGLPAGPPPSGLSGRYRMEGCVADTWSDTDWWCATCDHGFDADRIVR